MQAFLDAAHQVGRTHLPGTDQPVFAFIQRVLARLSQAGEGQGLLFPKQDGLTYAPFFDYCDAQGNIWVLREGPSPGAVPFLAHWFREVDLGDPEMTYFELNDGAEREVALAFLEALHHVMAKV
ncbi:MAG: hypothetical protein VKP62_11205 [Candidatus Sericytochromatia bacterium]|nr:hypothetical protein [Candidatus Sericytochromatia bacterium]